MIEGIDCSHYQGKVDWSAVARSGQRFGIVKATEGSISDPTFHTNWIGMEAAGLLRGAYHFCRPGRSAVNQAVAFVNTVHPRPTDLLVADFETTDAQSPLSCQAWLETFLTTVERLVGFKPVLYTSPLWFNGAVSDPAHFADWPLWVADYRRAPRLPRGFKTWALWQYRSDGTVPGIAGRVDCNRFNGDEEALHAFFRQTVTPPPAPSPVVICRGRLGGKPVALKKVTTPNLDAVGDGSIPVPADFLAGPFQHAPHDKYAPGTHDTDNLVAPAGLHQADTLRFVVAGFKPGAGYPVDIFYLAAD